MTRGGSPPAGTGPARPASPCIPPFIAIHAVQVPSLGFDSCACAGTTATMKGRIPSALISLESPFRQLPPNLTVPEIAKRLGVSYAVAYRCVTRFSYSFTPKSKLRRHRRRAILLANFKALPPRLTIAETAQRFHLSLAHAYRFGRDAGYQFRRKEYAPSAQRASKYAALLARIKSLPPDLSVSQVAKILRLSYARAHPLIRKAGYQFRTWYLFQKVASHQWDETDWSLSDAQIARDLGVSRERVRQVRQHRGIPKTPRQVYPRNSVPRHRYKDLPMTPASTHPSATRSLADNAIAKRALEAVQAIDREAQKKKLFQLQALEAAQQAIGVRIGEFQHQLVQLEEALAAIRPGAPPHRVQPLANRRDHDALRRQVKDWLQQRREERVAAGDIVQAFPALPWVTQPAASCSSRWWRMAPSSDRKLDFSGDRKFAFRG